MPCDLPYNCFNCPKLQQYINRKSLVEVRLVYCPIAMGRKPDADPKAVAQDA